jgi:hypothetical protein
MFFNILLIVFPAGGKFEGFVCRTVADGGRHQRDDADDAPPFLIIKTRPDDGQTNNDPNDAVISPDVAFHDEPSRIEIKPGKILESQLPGYTFRRSKLFSVKRSVSDKKGGGIAPPPA